MKRAELRTVCERSVRNNPNEIIFTLNKTKRKLTLRPKQKKTWSQWATEKHASFCR